jgi:hypothetical protein
MWFAPAWAVDLLQRSLGFYNIVRTHCSEIPERHHENDPPCRGRRLLLILATIVFVVVLLPYVHQPD